MQVWIGRNGERFGPYTEDEVRQWMRDGTVRTDELGWYEGMTDWRPLGELFPGAQPATGSMPPTPPPFLGIQEAAAPDYATFWARVGAWIIDYVILMVPFTVIAMAMGMNGLMAEFLANAQHDQTAAFVAFSAATRPISFALVVLGFVYYVAFECSKWQATPGKMALGLRVTDVEGRRLTPARAAARNVVRLVNVISTLVPFVCYLVTAFTQRKQGVHDLVAGTYVLVGRAGKVADPAPVRSPGSFDA
ncbi:RDD family protein [Luteibacter sp. PPL552]|jgi:uncharacterized RDD family membrane protein YckC